MFSQQHPLSDDRQRKLDILFDIQRQPILQGWSPEAVSKGGLLAIVNFHVYVILKLPGLITTDVV
jgi:hypothetical protein